VYEEIRKRDNMSWNILSLTYRESYRNDDARFGTGPIWRGHEHQGASGVLLADVGVERVDEQSEPGHAAKGWRHEVHPVRIQRSIRLLSDVADGRCRRRRDSDYAAVWSHAYRLGPVERCG